MANEKVIDLDRLDRYDAHLKTQANILQRDTNYSVGTYVCRGNIFLKCKTAGKTASTTLNLSNVAVGDELTDNTVTWVVVDHFGASGNGLNDWKSNTKYSIGDIFVYEGQIYKALIDFTSSSTFENIQILEDYELQTGDTPIVWAEGTEININDIVEYNGNYYKALYDFTCGSIFTKNVFEEYVPKSLTDEEVEEVINSYTPEFNGSTGDINYSEDEVCIGTWIDGKPLYQITIIDTMPVVTTTGTHTTKTIDIVSLNIKMCVFIAGFTYRENSFESIPINSTNNISDGVGRFCEAVRTNSSNPCADSIFIASSMISDSNQPIYITLQYTKITD